MARKSLANIVIESNMTNFPSTSSPLRRKSIVIQKSSSALLENDDEAERLALRRDATSTSTPLTTKINEKRRSLGLGFLTQMSEPQMTELISHCIKLSAENKINVKNAFSLEMIDFMTFMVTKRNSELTNLQVASTSLDVCTKIYGFRVDGIYTEILKMVGALDRQKENNSTDEGPIQSNNAEENEERPIENQLKKKKKRTKQKIIITEDVINVSVETMLPSQMFIGSGDLCSSDMLYQVVLSHHANLGFYHNTYNDIILDKLNETETENENLPEYTISPIENFSESDLCPSVTDFEFLKWSPEDEPEDIQTTQENNENRFQFDLDASIPSADEEEFEPMNYFSMQEDTNNRDLSMRNPNQVENIVDFRKVMAEQVPEQYHKTSEYSFIQKNFNLIHWAGPSYWKVKTLTLFPNENKVVETCHQGPIKKKKEIELKYSHGAISDIEQKFLPSQAVKLQIKTAKVDWTEEKVTLPEDLHYDTSQITKLYLRPLMFANPRQKDLTDTAQLPEDIEGYDYNNENDMSNFCPGIDTDCDMQERNDFDELRNVDENIAGSQMAFTNDNLVTAPTLTNKIFLQYPLRAKKIDMRQLKKTIWKSLSKSSNMNNMNAELGEQNENTNQIKESKCFNTVYKALPNELSKINVEALSVPIAIVSLLHLANEKSLKLSTLSDMSDIIVEGN
ncbi:condensin complex subunit 2-like [Vespa mandarinia]|uniref:condensin complex subunit 2-like n=1 Tax=Vespa mandarinia TaxID=7446 RepID=UPI001616AA5D|nr:condensin complex subunit 2-like [Vespa mandarinia]